MTVMRIVKLAPLCATFLILVACAGPQLTSPVKAEIHETLRDTHERLHGVLWMQTAAEYRALAQAMYDRARAQIDAALKDTRWTAAIEQSGEFSKLPPAVIFDIDETVLDNSPFQGQLVLNRSDYDPQLWKEWVSLAKADAVPGAIEFIRYLKQQGVQVFYVTNRSNDEESFTRKNLQALGLNLSEVPDSVLSQNERPAWNSDKSSRRKYLADSYRILLLVGDDLGDFTDVTGLKPQQRSALAEKYRTLWGIRWIILPNPAYGTWETSLYQRGLDDDDILRMKRTNTTGFELRHRAAE